MAAVIKQAPPRLAAAEWWTASVRPPGEISGPVSHSSEEVERFSPGLLRHQARNAIEPSRERSAPDDLVALARQARDIGRDALAAGDYANAVRWLDRAHRLLPEDGTLTLALATACLQQDDRRAQALFHTVAESQDVRAAWLGLAVARLRLGDSVGAADALAEALRRHTPDAALLGAGETLADVVVSRAGAVGWCGVTGDGRLVIRSVPTGNVDVRLDGQLCAGTDLPRIWTEASVVELRVDGRHLLGSPIQLSAIRRLVGFVAAHEGGLCGWAWHPGDPDRDPALVVRGADSRAFLRLTAKDEAAALQHVPALARPRSFAIPAQSLAKLPRPLQVVGELGAALLGSPIDPDLEQNVAAAAASGLARYLSGVRASVLPFLPAAMPADLPVHRVTVGASQRRRQIAIVIPVCGKPSIVQACLDSVLATARPPHQIIVVDDASPEPALRQALDGLATSRRIRLIRHNRTSGFPASANDGIAAAAARDVILLNSDTLVPRKWVERLHDAAYSASGIGTATPLSNHASILSYPGPEGGNRVPDRETTLQLDAAARRANRVEVVDIPVGIGFCLYLRRDCIDAVGPFRADVFAQGYGEENDFCLRARHLGWRHVAVTGLFVGHVGGTTFGQPGRHLQMRNENLLQRLHPGYDRLVAAFSGADPLAESRRRLDLVRWRVEARATNGAAILITHDDGGGVERQVGVSADSHRADGLRPIVLRPERRADGDALVVVDGKAAGFPNLRYALPRDMPALLRLLRSASPRVVEVHHTLHHNPAIYYLVAELGLPYDVVVHDYIWFCPQVALVGPGRRYCGEPSVAGCDACVADCGAVIDETIEVQSLLDRSAAFLAEARRVVVPSQDVATRMRSHFPGLQVTIVPQEDDSAVVDPPSPQERAGRCRVCILGAIGLHKGYDVLLACARDAAERRLKLDFVVVGHTIDDARLLATQRVFVTGRFKREEAVALIRAQQASLALLPSIWPETWSFGLTELWQAGLRVAAFDFGAPAERIRRTGRGFVLPLGLPPRGINDALVAAVGLTGHVETRTVAEPVCPPASSEPPSINHGANAKTAGRAHA